MLLELRVTKKKNSRRGSGSVTDLNKIVSASGLHHEEKRDGTVLEGSWDQLMAVAKQCHDEALKTHETFVTEMRAVDGPGVAPCSPAPGDCAAMNDLLEDDGDWLIP
jgi:uncharacterized protein YqgV (UPF0045/DUF77 family)